MSPIEVSPDAIDAAFSGGSPRDGIAGRRGSITAPHVENTPWSNTLQRRLLGLMDIREVLAFNLKKNRQAQGLSQEELAHRAEIDRTYISSLERCVYAAGIDVVDRLARVLGMEAADLLRRPSVSEAGAPPPPEA